LVLVKQLNFEGALKEIDELIQRMEKADRRKVDMTYYYLRALCYKKLEQYEKARADYEYFHSYAD
jgi:tetratricopeptide (TPR) repeat protein